MPGIYLGGQLIADTGGDGAAAVLFNQVNGGDMNPDWWSNTEFGTEDADPRAPVYGIMTSKAQSVWITLASTTVVAGDKYYFSVLHRTATPTYITEWSIKSDQGNSDVGCPWQPVTADWTVGDYLWVADDRGVLAPAFQYWHPLMTGTGADRIVHVANFVVCNLTAAYGAGREPSREQMRALLDGRHFTYLRVGEIPEPPKPVEVVPLAPTQNPATGDVAVPTMDGVAYTANGSPVGGQTIPNTQLPATVLADPVEGYVFPAGAAREWAFQPAAPPGGVPGQPGQPSTYRGGISQLGATATAPTDDGGSPINSYDWQVEQQNIATVVQEFTTTGPDSGLRTMPERTFFRFRARAVNANGAGDWSSWSLANNPFSLQPF